MTDTAAMERQIDDAPRLHDQQIVHWWMGISGLSYEVFEHLAHTIWNTAIEAQRKRRELPRHD